MTTTSRSVLVRVSVADTGEPTQNGLPEHLMLTIKEELVEYADGRSFDETRRANGRWLEIK